MHRQALVGRSVAQTTTAGPTQYGICKNAKMGDMTTVNLSPAHVLELLQLSVTCRRCL